MNSTPWFHVGAGDLLSHIRDQHAFANVDLAAVVARQVAPLVPADPEDGHRHEDRAGRRRAALIALDWRRCSLLAVRDDQKLTLLLGEELAHQDLTLAWRRQQRLAAEHPPQRRQLPQVSVQCKNPTCPNWAQAKQVPTPSPLRY